jgi:hypothetical protein
LELVFAVKQDDAGVAVGVPAVADGTVHSVPPVAPPYR